MVIENYKQELERVSLDVQPQCEIPFMNTIWKISNNIMEFIFTPCAVRKKDFFIGPFGSNYE